MGFSILVVDNATIVYLLRPETYNASEIGTNMASLYAYKTTFNKNINKWDTSNYKYGLDVYGATSFNQPVGELDVSNVTSMQAMFREAVKFNQPLNDWDVSNVVDLRWLVQAAAAT